MIVWLAIALGGAVGALGRHMLCVASSRLLGEQYVPWGIFTANVLGCFALGIVWALYEAEDPRISSLSYSALSMGFLGALTTFSTFGLQTTLFLQDSKPAMAVLNVAGNLLVGLVAVYVGILLAKSMTT